MAKTFNKNIFLSTYKDDYKDSDNYHRILFNNARAIQARELTQMQTITQRELSRVGRHFFKDGAAINPGGVTVNNTLEFIKLDTTVNTLPTDTSTLIGTSLTSNENVIVKVLDVSVKTDADPATLYVSYTNTSSATAGTTPIRVAPGTTLTGGSFTFTVQSINQAPSNLAVGQGTKVSILAGDFFAEDRFVFSPQQSKIISKYSTTPDTVIGFKSVQDIVTSNDTDALYDNTGSTPNKSAPGADRYRIRLQIAEKSEMTASDSFVYVAKIVAGKLVTQVQAGEDYNVLEDRLAMRTYDESGDYIVNPFEIDFDTNASDATKMDVNIGYGVAYVKGYRAVNDAPKTLTIDKPRTFKEVENEAVPIEFGNYLIVNGATNKGFPDINTWEQVNLMNDSSYGGAAIGTARIMAVEEHSGTQYKAHFFDVNMNSGQDARNIKSFGTDSSNYMNPILESNKAVFKDIAKNTLMFPVPGNRPKALDDVIVAVQRRFASVSVSGGAASINASGSGETFVNLNDMIISLPNGAIVTGWSASGTGSNTISLTGISPSSTTIEILAYVNKSNSSSRSKTLTARTDTLSYSAGVVNLAKADVYEVTEIKDGSSSGSNISNRFTVDNGQRDTHYGLGKLVLKPGQTAPSGNVYVAFKYFEHSTTGDFFSVNSYDGQVNYEDIPNYRRKNGSEVKLRDVVDFRSVVNSSGNYGSGARINELPQNTDVLNADISYYLGKAARIVIDTDSKLTIIESDPEFDPKIPDQPTNTLNLFEIQFRPYALDDEDMAVKTQRARRWTMEDITTLSKRVDKLEETTSLSLLETDTANLNVLDGSGNNRTKSGIFVDNFADHGRSVANNPLFPDYRASIDVKSKIMRPFNRRFNLPLVYRTDNANNSGLSAIVKKGDSLYMAYTHVDYEDQPLATETENVNPFAVIVNEGFVELSPATDDWVETSFTPKKVLPTETRIVQNFSNNWNNWLWGWAGSQAAFNQNVINTANSGGVGATVATRSFSDGGDDVDDRTFISGDSTVRSFVENRLLEVTNVPFMRSKKLFFRATGLKPNTRVFAFFDNVPVASWVRSETFQFATDTWTGDSTGYFVGNENANATAHPQGASTLTTGSDGSLEGSFFVPSTSAIKFRTGTREFKLLDISVPEDENSTCIATTPFTSTGVLETRQPTFSSTRTISVGGTRERRRRRYNDPLAQTFMVSDVNGIFVSKIGVRFATKDSNVTVVCQIRPTVNGVPSADDIIPNSNKILAPSSVSVPSVANPTNADTVVTYFEFDEPVFLNGDTEYAVVLLSDSNNYNVYVAKSGDFVLGTTERRVTKQPTLGSLFKSQNGRTWTADQTRDLTFVIQRANFTVGSANVYLDNARAPNEALTLDPFTTDGSTAAVKCFFPGHAFQVGDKIKIAGATATGGITAANINSTTGRTITKVDWTGVVFTAGANSSSAAIGGGSAVITDRQYMYNISVPQITSLRPLGTTLNYKAKKTTGKSYGGSETAYQRQTAFEPITPNVNNYYNHPQIIGTAGNEDTELGSNLRSAELQVTMATSDVKLTPIIDLQRCSLTMVENVIDNQTSSADAIDYLAETVEVDGSMASKHITQPIALELDAVGLKVFLAANRPSVANFKLYYRTNQSDSTADGIIINSDWTLATADETLPPDEFTNIFREYEYTIGGVGGTLTAFDQFQLKIVMTSTNSSKVPVFRDLRAIALTT